MSTNDTVVFSSNTTPKDDVVCSTDGIQGVDSLDKLVAHFREHPVTITMTNTTRLMNPTWYREGTHTASWSFSQPSTVLATHRDQLEKLFEELRAEFVAATRVGWRVPYICSKFSVTITDDIFSSSASPTEWVITSL